MGGWPRLQRGWLRQVRLAALFVLVTGTILGLGCWYLFQQTNHVFFTSFQERLAVQAALIAVGLDGDEVLAARSEAEPSYQRVKRYLQSRRAVAAEVRDVYTMRPYPDGHWAFGVDAEPSSSDMYAAPGEPYDVAQDPVIPMGLLGPIASENLTTDRWGVWLSGYAPIRDRQGRAVSIVGVDMAADDYLAERRVLERVTLTMFGLGLLALVLAGSFFAQRASRGLEAAEAKELAAARDRDQALAIAQARSDFLSMMSHEIRTPLIGVIGSAELILSTPLPPQPREYAEIVLSSARTLLAILNDILDFSKIEAGKVVLEAVPFTPAGLLEQVRGTLASRARERGLALVARVDPELPPVLEGDPTRLAQVLFNLVGNALKFTEAGSVSVRLLRVGAVLRAEVEDTGIGIAPAAAARLFQPFEQADTTTTRRYGGTGLGLSICRRLIELMGGEIGVLSTPGAGSTFWFQLPLRPATTALEPAPATSTRTQPLLAAVGPVLLADDHPVNRKIILAHLQALGLEAHAVENGQQALEAVIDLDPCLVLMDCQMPVLDGYEATRLLRETLGGRHLPVIALTADVMDGVRERCLAAGMDDALSKPFTQHDLRELLARWLPQAETRDVPGPVVGTGRLDRAELRELIGSEEELQELLELFRTQTHEALARMEQALIAQDAEEMRMAAHSLRGAAGNLTATEVAACSARLEAAMRHPTWEAIPAQLAELKRAVASLEAEELAAGPHGQL